MSLHSGRNYLKDFATSGELQPDTTTQSATVQKWPQPFDTKSQVSRAPTRRSQWTSSPSTASTAARAYAQVQAAQAQLAYPEKEANMMKQRAELDVHLHVLQDRKAIAEASAYGKTKSQSGELHKELCVDTEPIGTVQRTNEYGQQQCELLFLDIQHNAVQPPERNANVVDVQDSTQITNPVTTNSKPTTSKQRNETGTRVIDTYLPNPPKHTLNQLRTRTKQCTRFSKIRKELVSICLLYFDDKPEHYWT